MMDKTEGSGIHGFCRWAPLEKTIVKETENEEYEDESGKIRARKYGKEIVGG
jgi:hypothetical protein